MYGGCHMKKNMGRVIWMGILIGLVLLICGNAAAEGEMPINPYMEQVLEEERIANRLLAGPMRGGYTVNGSIVKLTEVTAPSLGGRGSWTISCNGNNGATVSKMKIVLMMKDYTDSYKTVYRQEGIATSYMSCEIVSGGDYELIAYVDFDRYIGSSYQYCDHIFFHIDDDDAHTSLSEKIAQVVGECSVSGDPWQTALNLHDWLTHHAYYDHALEYYGADGVLLRGYGVCDSYSKAYMMLLEAAGIPVRRMVNSYHAWNAIQINNTWCFVDVTWDDSDSSQSQIPVSGQEGHDYFCINNDLITGIMDQNSYHRGGEFEGNDQNPEIAEITSLDESWPIHTGEWREYGKYYDEDENTFKDYRDLILQNISQDLTIHVRGDAGYPLGGRSYLPWSENNKSYIIPKRYFYAYGLSREGIEVADENGSYLQPVSITYNTNDYTFTGTAEATEGLSDDGIILRYDGTRLEDGDAVGGRIQYKFYVENLPDGCTELQFGWNENMQATAPAGEHGGWGDDWRLLQYDDQGGTFFYVMPEMLGSYNSEIMFVRTGTNEPARRIALYYNRTPEISTPITFTNAEAPGYEEQGYTLTWSEASRGADFYYVVWEKPDSDPEGNFAGSDGFALSRITGATDAYGEYGVTVFAIANDKILQKSATWHFLIAGEPSGEPIIHAEEFYIGEYESIQIGVTLGENATEARANLDRNTEGDEEDLIFDDWAVMERSEGAEDEGYDGYIYLFPHDLEPGVYRLYVENSGEWHAANRISEEIVILEDPYQINTRMELPYDLTEIEEEAFAGTRARVVIIDDNVTKIGKRAFANSGIQYVVFSRFAENIAIDDDAFEESNVQVIFGFYEFAEELAEKLHVYYYDMWRITGDG